MTISSIEELDSFKYSNLQNLAKRLRPQPNLRVWCWVVVLAVGWEG